MQDLTQGYRQIIKQVSGGLKEIEDKLDKLPNKKTGSGGKKPEKEEETPPSTVIMSQDQNIVL